MQFTRPNQENICRISLKRTAGGGLISGVQVTDYDRELIPWGLCRNGDSSGAVSGEKGCRMPGLSRNLGWGGASAPTDRISGPA